jgi:hypothetical protein
VRALSNDAVAPFAVATGMGWWAAVTELAERLAAFRNEARNDLDVNPPLHTVEEWSRINATKKPWWQIWR